MRAIVVAEPGDPENMRWAEAPDPVAAAGEVLVRVAAAGVNRADLLQRQGFYPPPPGTSEVMGMELSGTVEALGDGVTGWSVGDEVCALVSGGAYAERCVVPAGQLLPLPAGVDLVTAAALPEVACTVHSNLAHLLHEGELLLVHGGSSGIGTFAIQWAVARGSRVAVTAGSAAKLERCRQLGAEVLVDYREQDFVEVVGSADVVLDNMGAKYLGRNLDVLATGGRLVIVGMQGGVKGELDIGKLLSKRALVTATSLRARPPAEKADIVRRVREEVWPLVGHGIEPVVDRTVPIADAADAHRLLADSTHVGKVLLVV